MGFTPIDFKDYPRTETPIDSKNLKEMQGRINTVIIEDENKNMINKSIITTEEEISENTNYTIPLYYKVGADVLDIFYMGEKLVKNKHYIEVGEDGMTSNVIQFYNWGQSVPANRTIEFITRGLYESVVNENGNS